jgi:hypothetical protein
MSPRGASLFRWRGYVRDAEAFRDHIGARPRDSSQRNIAAGGTCRSVSPMLKRRAAKKRWEKTMTSKLSVAVGAGIAVAGILIVGSWHASAMPVSGVALLHTIQKAEPVASYRIPKYRRCRIAGYRQDRYGYCVPSRLG